jgi:putative ABC transport system substrate-binding protein
MRRYIVWGTGLLPMMIVVLTTCVLPLGAAAQRPGHVPRIAFLELGFPPSPPEPTPFLDAFRAGLRERGWTEGHTLAIEWRWADGSLDRFATLVAEMIRLQVDVIVVPNLTTARIARKATSTIPIVVRAGGSLATSELITSLARPGSNVTGISTLGREIVPKQLERLQQALPGVTRVAVLHGVTDFTGTWKALEEAAQSLAMTLHRFEVREPTAFDSTFAAMTHAQVQALLVLGDPALHSFQRQIAALAVQRRLPSMCQSRAAVEAGCLMSYGPSGRGGGQQIATYVDKILRGATPAELPVEQVMQIEFVINLKTAQALELALPPVVLFQANEVIR